MSLLTAFAPLEGGTAALVERVRRSVVVVFSRHGHGSGVVWDSKGLIVTNHHVVPRERAEVELADGRRLAAEVVARDRTNDLALLRLEPCDLPRDGFPAVRIGDSEALRVGEILVAVGHPHGVRGTATLGVVSAQGAQTWMEPGRRDLLQADIALAPGSSGGPLVNTAGELVGVASMIMSPGIALAVPSQVVRRFVCRATVPPVETRERLAA